MSTIDSPDIIRKLINKRGNDLPATTWKGKRLVDDGRHTAYTIYQYISGFGSTCYKLIYGSYAQTNDNEDSAAMMFLATVNIAPMTTPVCIFRNGKLTDAGKEWWKAQFNNLPMP